MTCHSFRWTWGHVNAMECGHKVRKDMIEHFKTCPNCRAYAKQTKAWERVKEDPERKARGEMLRLLHLLEGEAEERRERN